MTTTPQRPRQPPIRYAGIAKEPRLREVLADPIVRTLMARDGVGIGDIRYLTSLLSGRRRAGDPAPAANELPGGARDSIPG